MIDTHSHLVYEGIDPENAIANAKEAGLNAIVTCGYPRDYIKNVDVARIHKGFVFLTLGLHPIDIKDLTDEEISKYLDYIRERKDDIIGIGEIGLDYHWFPTGKNTEQDKKFEDVFSKCIELAKELGKPVVIHSRKAEQACFDIINSHDIKDVVFHCYAGGMTLAKDIIDRGYMISLATNIDRSKNTKKIAKILPLEQLLTETDSPFLSPDPTKKNEPANVRHVVERISELRCIPFEKADEQTTENAVRFFKILLEKK